jgi:hypothetical protein
LKPLKTTAIPEISYSSSEDEDFFDAEEDDSDDDDDGSKFQHYDLTNFSSHILNFLGHEIAIAGQKIRENEVMFLSFFSLSVYKPTF